MSSRRRGAATWQDEVARSFSRLFSRTSSQEKEEEGVEEEDRSFSRLFFRSSSQEKKDPSESRTEEEQERSHSPSRLFFRKISQGGPDNVSPARGPREEQDRTRSFSRLFTRTSSQEKEEQSRHEDDSGALTADRRGEPPLAEPEQVTPDEASSPPGHNVSEEEKDGEFAPNPKVLDSEKQSRENFFHFIGNLFHFSPKSSLGNAKQAAGVREPSSRHEDAQVINNLDKEQEDQEPRGEDQRGAEQEQDPQDVSEGPEDAAPDTAKLNGHAENAPAITYGTYRGSRRIRKLLKRRADVNSPILEKEETPEACPVGDAPTENHLMLHEWLKMEPVPDRNDQDEIPPSKIQIKMQPKLEPFDHISECQNNDNIIQKAKDWKLRNGLEKEVKEPPISLSCGEASTEKSSEVVEKQPKIEEIVVPQPNAQESSETLQPNTGESVEGLPPTLGDSLNISGNLEQKVENSENRSKESIISKNLEPNTKRHHVDVQPKTVNTSGTVRHLQPNTEEVSMQPKDLQPNSEECVHFAEILQRNIDDESKTEIDPSPKVAESADILYNAAENNRHCLAEPVYANTDISNSGKYGTFSEIDHLRSEEDSLVKTEELEESSKENTKVPVDLDANMESALHQSHPEMAQDSGGCSNNQQAVEVNLNLEDKPHKGPSDLHTTTHNRSDKPRDVNCGDYDSLTSDCFKPEIERRSYFIDLQPNAPLVSSCTEDLEPNTMGYSGMGEELRLNGDEHSNQPNHKLNNIPFNKTLSESEDIPKLHLHLNETSEDLQQLENIEQVQTNANTIPENREELLKTELPPNTKVSFHLKGLNSTFSEKKPLESGDIPNLDLQLSETSRTSKDLEHIANTEHLQTNPKMIPENDAQKPGELLQSSPKVTFKLQETFDESPLKSTIISKVIENQKPNLYNVSHVSDDGSSTRILSKDKLYLEPKSAIHVPEIINYSLVHEVSQKHESLKELTETSHNNGLADEEIVHVDQPDGAAKELDLKPANFYDNPDNMTIPESSLNIISPFNKDHKAVTSRNISFDNGIECRSPSPTTMSDSTSYVDCNDVQFDSPNDSGIVSSQAYTPEELILFKTFPSEILLKTIPVPFPVDQMSEEASAPETDGSVNVQSVAIVQNKDPVININGKFEVEHGSHVNGYASKSGCDDDIKTLTPDKFVNFNSDVFVAKVSMKTVNIEEVKISPYGLCSDIISVAKLESPTFTKEVICLPNLSPPTDAENKFQVFHCAEDDQDLNRKLPNNRGEYLTMNKCEKHLKYCNLETEELASYKDNDVTMNLSSDLPNNDNSPHYTHIERGSAEITDKSPDVLIENLKNNNINVSTRDNIINVSLQAHKSEGSMSSDSLKGLRLGESLSELNPDSRVNHKEKLSDLLRHSALLHDVTNTNEIMSSCSATAKIILPGKDHSESSNESFEQKANEIIFSVLHSAIDELQNINQSHMIMSVNPHTLPDIKHAKLNLSENHIDLEDHPAEVLVKCPGKPSDHIVIEESDLIMSVAVGIVNDVISSSKQLVVSNMIPNGLSKDDTTKETTRQQPLSAYNGIFTDKRNDPVEDAANLNHVASSFHYDNIIHLPHCETNSSVLQVTTEASQTVESRKAKEPNSSNELGLRVTEGVSENDVEGKTEDEEHLNFSGSSFKADTYNLIHKSYTNGDLMLDAMYCGGQMESISLGTEGSMEALISNGCDKSHNSSEFSDFLQFAVYNSRYVEISGSDDELMDEEKDSGSEQVTDNESFLPVQSRRVRIYPYALSPIYEDESAGEDTLSNSSSPRYNQGAPKNNGGHDHTSILSLLQSVSDRLKEADLEEERFSSVSNEVSVNSKEESGELEDIIHPSKTSLDTPLTLEDCKTSLGARSGLFITKSFTDNKPNLVLGRQSFLLNLTSSSNIYGTKSSCEGSSGPSLRSEAAVSPTAESHQSTNSFPSTVAMNSLSAEPALPIHGSALDQGSHVSPKSIYYQYYNAAQNYFSNIEYNQRPAQEKPEEPRKRAEPDVDLDDSDSLKLNPRPGKVIISDIMDREKKTELRADVPDATSWEFPNGVDIQTIRGCWILYEKPHFEGRAHVLEEGEAALRHLWDRSGADAEPDRITIGSVRRVVKDYLPEIVISSLQDEADSPIYIRTEVPSLENLVGKHPRSLGVNSGVWLAYTEPQYNGAVTVLEEGSELRQIQNSGVKSMRPLKMGGLKVQQPGDPKIILYEKPHFQGRSREIAEHVGSIGAPAGRDVGSIQVIGGIWVGYGNEKYKGHQYLLEEGDYDDWHAWGGYDGTLQSIRYLQADFLESSVTLYETDEENGKHINLCNQTIPDLELVGYNRRTQCIHVRKGMWVAYRQKHFCGEQYVLEKGRYKTCADWGGSDSTIMSIRPVLLEPLGWDDAKHSIKVYARPEFQGEAMDFTQAVLDFTSFMPKSIKVLRGCWLLSYTGGGLCVLEEGHFPDLASCGCPAAEVTSIRPIDYVFAEPSISLFALDSCEGRELHCEEAVTSVLSKDLHFYVQSMWVRRGLWIAFEGANFLGRQMLLDPQQILNWSQFSGWKAIGSLRPVKQPSVYFMVKNRDKDKYLTVTGRPSDTRATFVCVCPWSGQSAQIWYFCRGFLKSKANDFCLDVIGGKDLPGSKVSLWAEHGKMRQKWRINKDGTISSYISDDLVLDLRGGNYYDQNYLVVNKVQEKAATQKWDMEIL